MRTVSNALHADLVKLLSSVAELPSDGTVRTAETKRKARLLKRKLEKCKTDAKWKTTSNQK